MIQTVEQSFAASAPLRMRTAFRFFRLLSAPLAVTIEMGRGGRLEEKIESIDAGVWFRAQAGSKDYNVLRITNPSTQTVKFLLCDDDAGYDRAFGTVSVDSQQPALGVAYTPALKTAVAASSVMLAANASRKYLMVQCPSGAANSVYLKTDGTAAAANANSFELLPGQTWEPPVPPLGEIRMIRGGGTDVDLHVIEG